MCSLRIWGRSKLSTIAWPQSITGSNCIAEEFKEFVSSYSKLFLNSMFSSNIWCVKKTSYIIILVFRGKLCSSFLNYNCFMFEIISHRKITGKYTWWVVIIIMDISSVIRILINQQSYYQNYLENGKCRMTVVIVYLNEQHIGNNHKLLLS